MRGILEEIMASAPFVPLYAKKKSKREKNVYL